MLETERKTRALRELQALCREVGSNDPEAFRELLAIQARFHELVCEAAVELNTAQGYSWAAIAAPLGITRQTAWERFGRPATERAPFRLPR